MFCQKCGREIADQARFCNHCGNPVSNAQSQQTVQPQAASRPQAAPAKKKSKAGKFMLVILALIVVFFGYFFIMEYVIYASKEPASIYTGEQALVDAVMSGYCNKGALYQDGYLTYSLAKVHLPDYTLHQGEGDEDDWLISPDGNSAFWATRVMDAGTSYKESDAEGILESFGKDEGALLANSSTDTNPYTGVSMVDFRKYEICGHPAIRYIVKYTYNGMERYSGELIIFDSGSENSSFYTVRLMMESRVEAGHAEIDRVFDSLQFSPDFALGSEYPQIGVNKITVK